jgi:hypothetical protein
MREKFGEVIDKFCKSSGIQTRWSSPEDWWTSALAIEAARAALKESGLQATDPDMILLGTDSPDFITPATSVIVQNKIGAKNAGTFWWTATKKPSPADILTESGVSASLAVVNAYIFIGCNPAAEALIPVMEEMRSTTQKAVTPPQGRPPGCTSYVQHGNVDEPRS